MHPPTTGNAPRAATTGRPRADRIGQADPGPLPGRARRRRPPLPRASRTARRPASLRSRAGDAPARPASLRPERDARPRSGIRGGPLRRARRQRDIDATTARTTTAATASPDERDRPRTEFRDADPCRARAPPASGDDRGHRDRPELVQHRIEVGHRDGVTPREIVGAIANEIGLEGRFIGAYRHPGRLRHRRPAGRHAAGDLRPLKARLSCAAGRCASRCWTARAAPRAAPRDSADRGPAAPPIRRGSSRRFRTGT